MRASRASAFVAPESRSLATDVAAGAGRRARQQQRDLRTSAAGAAGTCISPVCLSLPFLDLAEVPLSLSLSRARACWQADALPPLAGGSHVVGPPYSAQWALLPHGRARGRLFNISMPMAASRLFNGSDPTFRSLSLSLSLSHSRALSVCVRVCVSVSLTALYLCFCADLQSLRRTDAGRVLHPRERRVLR